MRIVCLGGHNIADSKHKICIRTYVPKGFRGGYISLYTSVIVDKIEKLRTVSSTGIYCSSDKVGTVYLVYYILENYTVNINALYDSCEDMACCSSVQCTVYCTVKQLYLGNRSE
jgi:hypothetical protein